MKTIFKLIGLLLLVSTSANNKVTAGELASKPIQSNYVADSLKTDSVLMAVDTLYRLSVSPAAQIPRGDLRHDYGIWDELNDTWVKEMDFKFGVYSVTERFCSHPFETLVLTMDGRVYVVGNGMNFLCEIAENSLEKGLLNYKQYINIMTAANFSPVWARHMLNGPNDIPIPWKLDGYKVFINDKSMRDKLQAKHKK